MFINNNKKKLPITPVKKQQKKQGESMHIFVSLNLLLEHWIDQENKRLKKKTLITTEIQNYYFSYKYNVLCDH